MADENNLILVSGHEAERISRAVLAWLQTETEQRFGFEYLTENGGKGISTIQAPYKTRQYILGGYEAQYRFAIINRLYAATNDERIKADDDLNDIAEWMEEADQETGPNLGDNTLFKKIRRDTAASLSMRYENGVEDHTITLTLLYEVNI